MRFLPGGGMGKLSMKPKDAGHCGMLTAGRPPIWSAKNWGVISDSPAKLRFDPNNNNLYPLLLKTDNPMNELK